ncbi:MAG: Gfo/Idh/MocA family oxidoreductase [Bryobacteraceae bacterium]|jgi:predicted dehydrogenase
MSGFTLTRRHFFYGSLLAGAIPSGGFGSAPSLKVAGFKSPNEKLNIAAIGAGGQAVTDIHGCASQNMVAFADPDSISAAGIFNEFPKAARYTDFRRMLEKESGNIDAVIIAIPDHMHGTAANWCMERGKHVYVEKPLTRTPWEARQLAASAAKYHVATQMGNAGYSSNGSRVAAEILWSGEIGNVTEVHAWTNRPIWPQGMTRIPPAAPPPSTLDWDSWIGIQEMRPYAGAATTPEEGAGSGEPSHNAEPRAFYNPFNWRGFFDFGCGPLGDMACHNLGAVNMALMLGAPTSVQVIKQEGTSPFAFPKKSVTVFEFPARHNMPPVKVHWYDGAAGPMYRPAGIPEGEPLIGGPGGFGQTPRPGSAGAGRGGRGARPSPQDNGAVFVGDKGFMTTEGSGGAVRLLPLARHESYKLPPEILTRSPGHHQDWIRACKGGEPACSNFSVAGPFTEWIVMGVIALHFEGKLEWDANKMQFTNNRSADAYVKPTFRKGWSFT